MEEAAFLVAVDGIVGGIEIQHDDARFARDGFDALIQQKIADRVRVGLDLAVFAAGLGDGSEFEAVEGAFAGQCLAAVLPVAAGLAERVGVFAGGGEQGIGAELFVVVEVFIAQREPEHPLADHDGQRMLDEAPVAGVAEAAGELVAETEAAVGLAQQQRAAVAREVSAAEIRLHPARTQGLKSESLLVTLCHRPFGGGLVLHQFDNQCLTQLTPGGRDFLVRNAG